MPFENIGTLSCLAMRFRETTKKAKKMNNSNIYAWIDWTIDHKMCVDSSSSARAILVGQKHSNNGPRKISNINLLNLNFSRQRASERVRVYVYKWIVASVFGWLSWFWRDSDLPRNSLYLRKWCDRIEYGTKWYKMCFHIGKNVQFWRSSTLLSCKQNRFFLW